MRTRAHRKAEFERPEPRLVRLIATVAIARKLLAALWQGLRGAVAAVLSTTRERSVACSRSPTRWASATCLRARARSTWPRTTRTGWVGVHGPPNSVGQQTVKPARR